MVLIDYNDLGPYILIDTQLQNKRINIKHGRAKETRIFLHSALLHEWENYSIKDAKMQNQFVRKRDKISALHQKAWKRIHIVTMI